MKTITLDFSQVDSGSHTSFLNRAAILGYTIIEGCIMPNNKESLPIPELYGFTVDRNSGVDSIIEGVPMSNQCKKAILADHFTDDYSEGQLQGGFLSLGKYFKSKEGIHVINHLAFKKNRKLRPGTALEKIQFWKQNSSVCPEFSVALGTVWNDTVIGWFGDCKEFEILGFAGDWRKQYNIFMVEEF